MTLDVSGRRLLLLLLALGACDAAPQPGGAASAHLGGTRVRVDPRFAHVIVAHQDERGQVVTRCVSQLEHPLDALQAPVRRAEVE